MKRFVSGLAALALIAGTGIAGAAAADPYYDHGYGYHDWREGDRVQAAEWRHWRAVEWRRHHLRRPARGYEWREYNGQYYQVGIGDGRIGAVIRIR